mmetsp:Transcript_33173/g.81529  ORF Transcript_33173/g.81529 Transcript_33173/m.81529 type:complete len:200 (-) Transcript_33173:208-807(-)
MPRGELTKKGCASLADSPPAVGYRTCPMPTDPSSLSMTFLSKMLATRPLSFFSRKRSPSYVTMPALSCPRCCSISSPSYSSALTLPATRWMPMMPHMRAACRREERGVPRAAAAGVSTAAAARKRLDAAVMDEPTRRSSALRARDSVAARTVCMVLPRVTPPGTRDTTPTVRRGAAAPTTGRAAAEAESITAFMVAAKF